MGRIREIPRTATFTWSPGTSPSYLATGTKAGAVDEGFSNDTQLELWDLDVSTPSKGGSLQPAASISTDSRFNDIAWTGGALINSGGIIAGALENGSLDLWDAEKLVSGKEDAFISRTSKHSGAVKALQFNSFRSELLATVGAKGELFISDVNNVGSPFRMGNAVARADDFECLDWNKRTSHIMVTGSTGGTMTVWDIKNKRESLTLNNLGRKPVSAVAWDPVKTTRLITAIPNDTDPIILVWDLRNANAPERILKGHDGGVLSLSWCPQDSDLLLSCGKDNRNICWNPQTGESYGEFPVVTNWTFQTRWNPNNPIFIATASFDGRISVQSIQNTKSDTESYAGSQGQALDDEDFFNRAQPQPQGTAFTLKTAPKWLQRPCGASFGFGGKVVTFKLSEGERNRGSRIRLSNFAIDAGAVSATESFEASLRENDLVSICNARIAAATSDTDKADWEVIKTLTSKNTRKDLIDYLGFTSQEDEGADGISKLPVNGDETDYSQPANGTGSIASKASRLSAFFDNNADGDNFLSELAATKGATTNNPFRMYTGSESESDRRITHALLLGKFEKALDVCLRERRMSDAFMIAISGGQSCIEKAQKAYLNQKENGPNYLRLLTSIVGKNLWDLVHNADVENWKEIMATLCTYANTVEFPDLCEALGDRLEEHMKTRGHSIDSRKDAAFCFLAGSKLEKIVPLWLIELREREISGLNDVSGDSAFSIHMGSLQSFIEKVTVYREVMHYQDDQQRSESDWKLAPLYDKYVEYADIASAHGQLQIAERYLDLLPRQYTAADVAKSRVKIATRKATPQTAPRQPTTGTRGQQRMPLGTADLQQHEQQSKTISPPTPQANKYAPASIAQPYNPYTHASGQRYGGASHAGYQQQPQMPQQPALPAGVAYSAQYQNGPPGPSSRDFNASPSVLPPSKAANIGNWNDMPESFFKPPTTSRRGTPGVPANGPIPFQPLQPSSTPQIGPPPKSTAPLDAPPKPDGGPPQTSSSPANASQSHQESERPPSTNPYAPAQSSLSVQQQSTIPRGPSPYNAPPSAPPSNNRYTPSEPAASIQPDLPIKGGVGRHVPPPPPPSSNPYLPQQNYNAVQQGGLPPQQAPPPSIPPQQSTGPPSAPPRGSRPNTTQSERKSSTPSKYRKLILYDLLRCAS